MEKTNPGPPRMIDVGGKEETKRIAAASGRIRMKAGTLRRILAGDVPKGDVAGTARVAGIMAAKRTWEIIPLCHPVRLTAIDISVTPDEKLPGIHIEAVIGGTDRTGVEMEALTAVSVGLLTIYDMVKGIDREMEISRVHLDRKEGGRGGRYVRNG